MASVPKTDTRAPAQYALRSGADQKTPPTLHQKKPSILYRKPSSNLEKTPKMDQKTSLLTLPEWTSANPLCTNKNTLSTEKKQVSYPCMLHLWTVVYQKPNLVAPFYTKRPQDGLPWSFFLSTTFYNSHTPVAPKQNIEKTLTFISVTFHSLPYLHA